MTYAVGSLVKARGREWVVLPDSSNDLLVLRPLGGTEDEVTGIFMPLETVEPAQFALPDPSQLGDHRSCRILRDAIRLGFRSSAGPFRSFAKIAVEPRPYQLVPLLMALKLDPVRILIADDVGIGKTIEACLIARELIDRGEVQRMAVLCPPHLAEQWQWELREKFHIEAELVLPSTVPRLERRCSLGQSLFELYPFVIVSTDFIKSDRHRNEFLRTCPELVIVDEAHTCAFGDRGKGGKHQRFQLLSGLAEKPERHMILVTATPHSGKEEAFRSLLTFLGKNLAHLPADLSGKENEANRRQLALHFVQRRRADIRHYMQADTPFPEREDAERTYNLSPAYKKLFEKVLNYVRETVKNPKDSQHRQRVRWWSALALLRSLASSPAAAAATLRTRASVADTDTLETADEIGRRSILDMDIDDAVENIDVTPGSMIDEDTSSDSRNHRLLLELARQAEKLYGDGDEKLLKAVELIKSLLKDGFKPIIFCRFITTAEYLAEELRKRLPKSVDVVAVTGTLPPAEREERILSLAESEQRILVATDCLSEGINLQEQFDAVMHYDLSWSPTRHEQREGRVDRYGQPRNKIRVVTYYGIDNQIDGIVLDILIRKHKTIRNTLGISVPVPVESNSVIEAIFEGLLLRENTGNIGQQMSFDFAAPIKEDLFNKWDNVTEREKRSRTVFAQESIKVEDVARELKAMQEAIGSGVDVERFTLDSLKAYNAVISGNKVYTIDLSESPLPLKEAVKNKVKFNAKFELPLDEKGLFLTRTHPLVENLASYVMDTALESLSSGIGKRCGVIRTSLVERRTTLLLTRLRYHIITKRGSEIRPLLAEDCQVLAFEGSPQNAAWLDFEVTEKLLKIKTPDANINPDQAKDFLNKIIEGFDYIKPQLEIAAREKGEELLEAHQRVRSSSRQTGISYRVEPHLPPDVIGIYIYLPMV
ncbi:ATP-dependent helicase [Candidatus Parcubacteria bacterium]|nr:MAG: ATP-dependent helicase [Candidatus Parcubacteria bacterium]